jgi:hypothetical protein
MSSKNKQVVMKEIPMRKMSGPELQRRLLLFAARARSISGTGLDENGQMCSAPLGQEVSDFLTNLSKNLTDPAAIRAREEFLAKVEADPEARKQFCALQLKTYNNYLIAEMRWMNYFFHVTTLGPADRPMVQNHYDKEVKCYFVGADGRPKQMKLIFDDTETLLPLRIITSPKMKYKAVDLYRGNIVDQAVRSLTVARDLANRMENESKLMLLTTLGAFTFTGPKANWPFVANSYIDIGNLPTNNDVAVTYCHGAKNTTNFGDGTLATTGAQIGAFDYSTLDEIINYAKLLDAVRLPGSGEFRPTGRIRVASTHIRNFGTYAAGSNNPGSASVAAAAPSKIQEGVYEEGWGGVTYKGIDWTFEPDATLDPTLNQCYPEFSIKPGEVFLKPSMDKEVIRTGDQDYALFQDNEEERWMKKVFQPYVNSAQRIYFARFNY